MFTWYPPDLELCIFFQHLSDTTAGCQRDFFQAPVKKGHPRKIMLWVLMLSHDQPQPNMAVRQTLLISNSVKKNFLFKFFPAIAFLMHTSMVINTYYSMYRIYSWDGPPTHFCVKLLMLDLNWIYFWLGNLYKLFKSSVFFFLSWVGIKDSKCEMVHRNSRFHMYLNGTWALGPLQGSITWARNIPELYDYKSINLMMCINYIDIFKFTTE